MRRCKDFSPDIQVDWVRMIQSVLRYNVVIVGKFFNKGSWVSEAWRKDHPEDFVKEPDGPHDRIPMTKERMERLHVDGDPVSVVCVDQSTSLVDHLGSNTIWHLFSLISSIPFLILKQNKTF